MVEGDGTRQTNNLRRIKRDPRALLPVKEQNTLRDSLTIFLFIWPAALNLFLKSENLLSSLSFCSSVYPSQRCR